MSKKGQDEGPRANLGESEGMKIKERSEVVSRAAVMVVRVEQPIFRRESLYYWLA